MDNISFSLLVSKLNNGNNFSFSCEGETIPFKAAMPGINLSILKSKQKNKLLQESTSINRKIGKDNLNMKVKSKAKESQQDKWSERLSWNKINMKINQKLTQTTNF